MNDTNIDKQLENIYLNVNGKKAFRFSRVQHLDAYKLTKALNGMGYIRSMYVKEYIDEMEAAIKKEESNQDEST